MAYNFDIRSIIKVTLQKILQTKILLVFYKDSKFLYDSLVKLASIHKKRYMIDVIILCQSYKSCKITKFKWIYKFNNPADLMTKSKSF